jgi:hypothetical protein
VATVWLVGCALSGVNPSVASDDQFQRLSAAEIRATIVGNVVTDESHWSDRFETSGSLRAIELGHEKRGTWTIEGDELCMKRETRERVTECYEIWLYKNEVEYRRDGVTVAVGVVRKPR